MAYGYNLSKYCHGWNRLICRTVSDVIHVLDVIVGIALFLIFRVGISKDNSILDDHI